MSQISRMPSPDLLKRAIGVIIKVYLSKLDLKSCTIRE